MSGDLFRATLAETIALHEKVKDGDARPLIAAAAAVVASVKKEGKLQEVHRTLLHVMCDFVERAIV